MPVLVYAMEVPERLVRSDRLHNRLMKDTMRETAQDHWRRRIPGHFQRPAHGKYHYAERSKKYRFYKQRKFGSSIDLVRTGRTRHVMRSQKRIVLGGSATGRGVVARLILRFPFPGGTLRFRDHSRQRVTLEQMMKEIRTITDDEGREIATFVKEVYVRKVETDTSARQRIKVK